MHSSAAGTDSSDAVVSFEVAAPLFDHAAAQIWRVNDESHALLLIASRELTVYSV